MNRATKYLTILENKMNRCNQSDKCVVFKYPFFKLQKFNRKFDKKSINLKRKFLNEIKEILFGYGDSRFPDKNSISLIENIIIKFVSIIVVKINFISSLRLSKRPMFEDILFIIRKSPSKTKRVIYLIKMKKVIEKLVKQTKASNQVPKEIISHCKKHSPVI